MTSIKHLDNVRVAAFQEAEDLLSTLTLAFAADPWARWLFPSPAQYVRNWPRMSRAFAGDAFGLGTAYCVADYRAAALWLPPGTGPDQAVIDGFIRRTVGAALHADAVDMAKALAGFRPAEPHWYLSLQGVDPAYQGQGLGSALLSYALQRCDREERPASLEATGPAQVAIYQRHGFEQIGVIQIGASPSVYPMVRPARCSAGR